jgi:hypothetical protein
MASTLKGGCTRTKFTLVKVPMKANRMQKPMAKLARCEERRRDRQQDEADQDAAAPIDAAREIADGETGDEHAEGARIGSKPHLARRHAVMRGEHRRDGLRGEA